MDLRGIYAPLTTPFAADESVHLDQLASNVASYNGTGLHGYLVLGSSGEAICLDRDEKLAVLRQVAQASAPGKLLMAGTGEESLRATLDMTERAAVLGYHAAVVRTPHYYKSAMSQTALTGYYRALAARSPIPVLAYNIPPLTGVDLSLEATLALAREPNVIGLKESSGNMDKLVHMMAALDAMEAERFAALVGGPATLYPSLCVGAPGAILALAAAAPETCLEIYAAFTADAHATALELQRRALPACKALAQTGIAGLKFAVECAGGRHGGPPRLPQLPLSAEQRAQVEAAFAPLRALAHA